MPGLSTNNDASFKPQMVSKPYKSLVMKCILSKIRNKPKKQEDKKIKYTHTQIPNQINLPAKKKLTRIFILRSGKAQKKWEFSNDGTGNNNSSLLALVFTGYHGP